MSEINYQALREVAEAAKGGYDVAEPTGFSCCGYAGGCAGAVG
ncbi:ead/Ea22-like family protein [Escherichia coli]